MKRLNKWKNVLAWHGQVKAQKKENEFRIKERMKGESGIIIRDKTKDEEWRLLK